MVTKGNTLRYRSREFKSCQSNHKWVSKDEENCKQQWCMIGSYQLLNAVNSEHRVINNVRKQFGLPPSSLYLQCTPSTILLTNC